MGNKKPELWGTGDEERLEFSDENECIESILDGMDNPLPEKIIICGFARMDVDIIRLNPLEHCLEQLDEEHGDPDGEYSEPTEAMKAAEKSFLEIIKKEYKPWACEEVCRKEIIVADWIEANRPDWISSGEPH